MVEKALRNFGPGPGASSIEQFGERVWQTSLGRAEDVLRKVPGVQGLRRRPIVQTYLQAFLMLIDRDLYATWPEARDDIVDTLSCYSYFRLVAAFTARDASNGDIIAQINAEITEHNEALASYAALQQISPVQGQDTMSAFCREFAKRLATAAGREGDTALITLGMATLVAAFKMLEFPQWKKKLTTRPQGAMAGRSG